MSRFFGGKLIYSPINSNHRIKLSLHKPSNNGISLNIIRPKVSRQYSGKDTVSAPDNKNTYVVTFMIQGVFFLVGMDPRKCVPRRLTPSMAYVTNELHEILSSNKGRFNLQSIDTTKNFNPCIVLT